MTRVILTASVVLAAVAVLVGCDDNAADAPPQVRLGESPCALCNMIISDERFATATIIEGPRGPEPRLFDDFNCQAQWEAAHADQNIVARWSHDYSTTEWIRTEDAVFVTSPELRTPMASKTAAFATRDAAERARAEVGGEVRGFEGVWGRLGEG